MATIRKRGDTYQIRVSLGYDKNGNHKEQAMTWRPDAGMTERQIQKELNRQAVMFEEACMHGYKAKAVKFEELAEEWFEEYAKLNLRSTTYERMKQLTHRIYPAIGHLRIDKISPRQLQGFVNSLTKEGANEKTGKPLAPKTIRHNLSFISDVYSYAVKMGVVSDNPCAKVTIPKGEVKEKQIYSQEELELLLSKLTDEPTKYRAFFYLISYTGLRRSELLGLQWGDLDFEKKLLHIQRAVTQTKGGILIDKPKTKTSIRAIPISDFIIAILEKMEQTGFYVIAGKHPDEPMKPHTYADHFSDFMKRMQKETGLPILTPHELRHTFGTLLRENDVDIYTIQKVLGHSDITVTSGIYVHNDIEVLRKRLKVDEK